MEGDELAAFGILKDEVLFALFADGGNEAVAYNALDIAANSRRGGKRACALTVEYNLTDSRAGNAYSVEGFGNSVEEALVADQVGSNEQASLVADLFGNGYKTDNTAELFCKSNILARDVFDTLDIGDIVIGDVFAERDACKDSDLSCGVKACDICVGVCLGIAQFLRRLQSLGKALALALHVGEDIVGGAVEDTCDANDIVGCEAFVKRCDYRNTAADACLVKINDAVFTCDSFKLAAVFINYRLVGGNDGFACLKCGKAEFISNAVAAHRFEHDADAFVVDDLVEIGGNFVGKRVTLEGAKV